MNVSCSKFELFEFRNLSSKKRERERKRESERETERKTEREKPAIRNILILKSMNLKKSFFLFSSEDIVLILFLLFSILSQFEEGGKKQVIRLLGKKYRWHSE